MVIVKRLGKKKSCKKQKRKSPIITGSYLLYVPSVLSLCKLHGLFKSQLPHL